MDFQYPDDEAGLDETKLAEIISQVQEETAVRVLQNLCDGDASMAEIGRAAVLTLHRLRRENTHAQIAERIGVSRVRVTQMLTSTKAKYKGF